MLTRPGVFISSLLYLFFMTSTAFAQYPVVSGDQVKSWLEGKKKIVLIDSRLSEEYIAGHVPGAINIPAERMQIEAKRLPSDKTTPVIFYCRGAT